jgi:hypothetical protein
MFKRFITDENEKDFEIFIFGGCGSNSVSRDEIFKSRRGSDNYRYATLVEKALGKQARFGYSLCHAILEM